jgi:hypothetical protein
MKVDFHVIASGGVHYDQMKKAWIHNWETDARREHFPDSELRFLYCTYAPPDSVAFLPTVKWDKDVFVGSEETIKPGILLKTVENFKHEKLAGDREDRWVIRTNLSSFYVWKPLRDFLDRLESEGIDAAGYTGTEDHFSGCGFILGPRAMNRIIEASERHELDFSVEDDLAMSRVLFADDSIKRKWVPRIDHLGGSSVFFRGAERDPEKEFHFRVKSEDRGLDAALLRDMAQNPGKALEVAKSAL